MPLANKIIVYINHW